MVKLLRWWIMAVKQNKNEKGQAIFELIIFLPIFLFLIKSLFDYGDAINLSINQLKVVRGYYFYSVSHDTMLPSAKFLEDFKNNGVNHVSLDAFSWSLDTIAESGGSPVGACVKVYGFLGNEIEEECREANPVDRKTQFIRIYSSFGVCSGTWSKAEAASANPYVLNWQESVSRQCARTE